MALEWNGICGGVLFAAFNRSVVMAVTRASTARAEAAHTTSSGGGVIMRYYGHSSPVKRMEVVEDVLVSVSASQFLTHQIKVRSQWLHDGFCPV